MDLSADEIRIVLLNNGFTVNPKSFHNRVGVICPDPSHGDKDFGNCFVFLNSLQIHCFRCHFSKSLQRHIADEKSITIDEARTEIGLQSRNLYQGARKKKDVEIKRSAYRETIESLVDFDPLEFEYTRIRGYTRVFLDEFNIKLCYSGKYKDYFIIPIKELSTFEARKLKEKESLVKFLDNDGELEDLRLEYKTWRKLNLMYVHQDLYYLDRPKTLYESGVMLKKPIIYNQSNLDYDSDVEFSEGTATLPKLWTFITKNCSCSFGAIWSELQIRTLMKFKKRKIIIPDNDEASRLMVKELCTNVPDVWVRPIKVKDKHPNFVNEILTTELITGAEYMMKPAFAKLGI